MLLNVFADGSIAHNGTLTFLIVLSRVSTRRFDDDDDIVLGTSAVGETNAAALLSGGAIENGRHDADGIV